MWEVVGSTGEWAGAAAVVVTLFYLATQIRQQNKIARNQVWQRVQAEHNLYNKTFVDAPEKMDVYQRGLRSPDGLDDSEIIIFTQLMRMEFNTALATFKAFQDGLVDESDWNIWAQWFAHTWFNTPGGKEWQTMNSNVFPDFWNDLEPRTPDRAYGEMSFRRGYDRGLGGSEK